MIKIDRIAKDAMEWSVVIFVGLAAGVMLLSFITGLAGVILG